MGFFEDWEEKQRERLDASDGNLKPWDIVVGQAGQATDPTVPIHSISDEIVNRVIQTAGGYDAAERHTYTNTVDDINFTVDTIRYQVPLNAEEYERVIAWIDVVDGGYGINKPSTPWSHQLPYKNYYWKLENIANTGYTEASTKGIVYLEGRDSHISRTIIGNHNQTFLNGLKVTFIRTETRTGFLMHGDGYPSGYTAYCVLMHDSTSINEYLGGYTEEVRDVEDMQYGKPADLAGFVGGAFNAISDSVLQPNMPSLGVSTAGFINVYKVDQGALSDLGSNLFTDVTIEDIIEDDDPVTNMLDLAGRFGIGISNVGKQARVVQAMGKNASESRLVQYIVDCHIIPCTPSTQSTKSNIELGPRRMSQQAYICTSDYVDFDCGSVSIAPYYGNFLDFNSVTCKLYLPFIGFVNLDPNYFTDASGGSANVHVQYRFNIIDGSCIATVQCTKRGFSSVVGVFSGTCCVHLPITGETYAQIVSGYTQNLTSLISAGASGSLPGTASAAIGALSGLGRPNIGNAPMSNGYSCSGAFMGNRRPFMLLEYPVQQLPSNYMHTNGALTHKKLKLSELVGFAVVDNIDMTGLYGIDAAERDEIRQLLENGVYL